MYAKRAGQETFCTLFCNNPVPPSPGRLQNLLSNQPVFQNPIRDGKEGGREEGLEILFLFLCVAKMFPNGSHLFAKCSGVNSFRAIILITAPK
jgi:hypothetical protein